MAGSSPAPATLSTKARAKLLLVDGHVINQKMFYYTYVLRSEVDGNFYIGCASDLDKRVLLHNSGRVHSTKDRRPLKLIYFEACQNQSAAFRREKALKTGFGRLYLKNRISEL